MIGIDHATLVELPLCAFALSVSAIPITRQIATRLGVVAAPNRALPNRKAVPLLAGAPILLAILISLGLFGALPFWMLLGGGGLMMVGLLDDVLVLRPRPKFALQMIIVAAAAACRQTPALLPWPWLNSPLTILWLLATVNAFNLIDGLDGLAGGVGIAIGLTLAALGLTHQSPALAFQGMAIAGALAGFLVFNFHPASIFMGDCGALPLGFLLGALALDATAVAASSRLALYMLPLLIMMVPLLDMSVVSISRMATSSRITRRGHDHSHHKLLALGLPDRTAAAVCWTLAAVAGACAMALASITPAYAIVALPFIAAGFGLIAFFMIDLTFEKHRPGDTYPAARGIARLLLNFGYKRRLAEGLLDFALISAAYIGAFLVRFNFVIDGAEMRSIIPNLPYVLAGSYAAFFLAGVYRGLWRYAGLVDIPRFAYAAIGAGIALLVASYFVPLMLSGSIVVLFVILLFNLLAASRLSFKAFREAIALLAHPNRRVLIVGAGTIGEAAARYVAACRGHGMKVVGLVDNDPFKTDVLVYGSVVYGTVADLSEIHKATKFNEILIACDPIAPVQMETLMAFARNHALPVMRFSIEVSELTRPLNAVPAGSVTKPLRNIAAAEKVVA